jgi:hypothetical protein
MAFIFLEGGFKTKLIPIILFEIPKNSQMKKFHGNNRRLD